MSPELNYPLWTTGRRKESVARVRIVPGDGKLLVNDKSMDDYFGGHRRAKVEAMAPLQLTKVGTNYNFFVSVMGGGVSGQSGAIKLGLARAIAEIDPAQKSALRKGGFLTRDPRMVERKKPGQPKARRRFQHSKR
ncbi:MAG: 30S ribosomal protein S9 [Elusimicrobia bacterium]|nr:30S ribosomal protein S9 [Candidatus Obscuribacterium magneticum]